MIAPNVILAWPGTNAAIPTGYSRETDLDGKYPKSSGGEAPDTTGGSNTHTHTASAHGHTANSHSHSVSLNHVSSGSGNADDGGSQAVADNHGHSATSVGNMSGGSLQNTVVTWSSVNHEPPYYELIFVKADSFTLVADDLIGFWNTSTIPSNFNFTDGQNGTIDLRNKYPKGAAAGQDAGTTGGATNHSHSVTHGHTANSHTHTGTSPNQDGGDRQGTSGTQYANRVHTHSISLSGATDTVNDYTNTTAGSGDTVEPAYKKTLAIQNTSGNAITPPIGLIAMWLGALADIPAGWYVCDGNNGTPNLQDKFIKIANDTSEIGNTGGSNTHSHSSISHTHTATGTHTHTGSTGGPSSTANKSGQEANGWTNSTHTHALTVGTSTATYQNTNIDCDTVDNQPAYRTAAYIMFSFPVGGGALAAIL